MTKKSRVFIVSNTKRKSWAESFKTKLMELDQEANKLHIIGWWEPNVFKQGDSTSSTLLKESENSDFALIFLTEDKIISTPEEEGEPETKAPSHNCIFELGLFTASLGRDRCFVLSYINARNLGKVFSDYRGENFKRIIDSSIDNQFHLEAQQIKDEVYRQGYRLKYEQIRLITMDDLKELEIRKTAKNNGNLSRSSASVIVNSAQPLELGTSFAKRVKENLDKGISYKYFFSAIDDNLGIVAELFQSLAGSHLDVESITEIKTEMEKTISETENNLRQLKDTVTICFLKDIQPIEFCIHNAGSLDDAICYLRRPDNNAIKFVEWASGRRAYDIGRNLNGFCLKTRGNKFIFRSTKDIDIYLNNSQELLQELEEKCLNLFPAQLHNLVKEVCFRSNL